MKVLHVLNDSLPNLCGYTVRSAEIVRLQSALGLEPVVVTSPHHEPPFTEDVELLDGVRHYRTIPLGRSRVPLLHEARAIRRTIRRIDEVVRIERPDVLHAHSPCLWGEAALWAARRHRLPLVYEVRGFWEDAAVDLGKMRTTSLKYRLIRAWETRIARRADVVTVISEQLKVNLVQRGIPSRKIMLSPNGVHIDAFTPRPPDGRLLGELGLNGSLVIGYVGTFYPWEGVDDLLRAAGAIVARAPHVKFVIVGGGEEENSLCDMVRRLDLGTHVRMVGRVPREDVPRYYSILDLLVYPRKSTLNTELVTPLKPLEAMAMEKAVLASDVGGLRELLAEGTGLLFRAGDGADLVEKCLQLVADGEKRQALGRRARAHVLATRDWRALAARYVDVYAAAAEARRRRGSDRSGSPPPELAASSDPREIAR